MGKGKVRRAKKWTSLVAPDHPVLKKKAERVKYIDDALKVLINDMYWLMSKHKGIGLAAPQVGCSKRVVVMCITQRLALINPVIIETIDYEEPAAEGCLTFGAKNKVMISRPMRIRVKYSNRKGVLKEETFFGLAARCLQHEIDHLDGKLITDYGEFIGEENGEDQKA